MLTKLYVHALGASLTAGFFVVAGTDKALSQVPGYRQTRDRVLDNLFGPAEEFEYTAPTTPK